MAKALLQPPRLRTAGGEEGERHATWLELFYDLVFVVAVAELAHTLAGGLSWGVILGYAGLFVPVWWAWVGSTFYASRFDTDDLGHRIFMLLQMAAAVALAVNVHNALNKESGAVAFALSYVLIRALLVAEYLRAMLYVAEARPLLRHYIRGFTLSIIIWLISTLVPAPWRYVLWAIGMVVDIGTPITASRLQIRVAPDPSHTPERLGLFTIIVLGEGVASVVRGISEQQWSLTLVVAGVLGLAIAFALWWIYFEHADGSVLVNAPKRGNTYVVTLWLYTHLPLAIGLAAVAIGIERIVPQAEAPQLEATVRWLLCGSVALTLVAVALIHLSHALSEPMAHRVWQVGSRFLAAALVLAIGLFDLSPLLLLVAVAVVCAALVSFDLALELTGPDEEVTEATAVNVAELMRPPHKQYKTQGGHYD